MMAGKTSINTPLWLLLAPILLLYAIGLLWGDGSLHSLCLPSDWRLLVGQPWSIITYGFVHTHWQHFAINLVALTLSLLLAVRCGTSMRAIIALFLAGTIAGGLFFILIGNGLLVGSSAGITAILPLVIYHWVKGQQLVTFIILSLVILLDAVTHSQIGAIALGVHLIGYLIGVSYLFIIHPKVHQGETETIELTEKANTSGYASLTKKEQKTLTAHDE